MKFVRWLGAFETRTSLSEAVGWELSQTERQVAVEPLWRGQSTIGQSKIGLVVDESRSLFVKGWTCDAYTETLAGCLRPAMKDGAGRQGKAFKDMDRFLRYWNKNGTSWNHGEVVFDAPVYKAVVVKSSATEHGMSRARRLTAETGLPLVILKETERK